MSSPPPGFDGSQSQKREQNNARTEQDRPEQNRRTNETETRNSRWYVTLTVVLIEKI